jgi:hypothetical protein
MKPRHVADLLGFVTYYYATNRQLPTRSVIAHALRDAPDARFFPSAPYRDHHAFDTGRGMALSVTAADDREEEQAITAK